MTNEEARNRLKMPYNDMRLLMWLSRHLEQTELNPSYNGVKSELNPCEDMRDATEEERKSTKDYIDSISKPTGLQFDDTYEELDFVQPHKKISVKLRLCEDCISRNELLSRIDAERKHLLDIKMDGAEHIIVHHARRIIEDMPSVTPKTRWIPCSERMPDINIHVLAQFVMGGMAECYYAHNWWHIVGGFRISGDEVIAWMPLPQPYRESKVEE